MSHVSSATLPFEETRRIIHSYSMLLEDGTKPIFMDESVLPATKEKVKKALWAAIATTRDAEHRKIFKSAYLLLAFFLPGVGLKAVTPDNVQRWCELAKKMEREMRALKEELESVDRIHPLC